MQSMFDSYDNLQKNYIPDNQKPKPIPGPVAPCRPKFPYEEYDAEGKLIGYFWNYGDTVTLQFNIDGFITVEDNAIIYTEPTQEPTKYTPGEIDQRIYNIIDLKSWTCTAIENAHNYNTNEDILIYIWTQDAEFTYPIQLHSRRNIYLSASEYLKNKTAQVRLYNFRMEQIYVDTFKAVNPIVMTIDKELSDKMVKGVYYCSLTIYDENDRLVATLFNDKDCVLTVK